MEPRLNGIWPLCSEPVRSQLRTSSEPAPNKLA